MFKSALVSAAAGIVMSAYSVHIESESSSALESLEALGDETRLAQTSSGSNRWDYERSKREQELMRQRMANRRKQRGRYRRNFTLDERQRRYD